MSLQNFSLQIDIAVIVKYRSNLSFIKNNITISGLVHGQVSNMSVTKSSHT